MGFLYSIYVCKYVDKLLITELKLSMNFTKSLCIFVYTNLRKEKIMNLDNQFKNKKELKAFLKLHLENYISEKHGLEHHMFKESKIILGSIHKEYGTIEFEKLVNILKWNK